jgi:hypothetical protein
MSINESSFSINVTSLSGENYAGAFKARKRLSHIQTLRRDELRRELLGAKPEVAPDELKKNAFILSTCAAYVFDGPRWWLESDSGQSLVDEEPVAAVYEEVAKVVKAVNDELEAKQKKSLEAMKAD